LLFRLKGMGLELPINTISPEKCVLLVAKALDLEAK